MPTRPKRPCSQSGCHTLVTSGRCTECRRKAPKQASATKRLYDADWRRESAIYLRSHPVCLSCQRNGRATPATCVDHIKPHKGDPALFWDRSNWEASCRSCNSTKAASDEGGYGNAQKGGRFLSGHPPRGLRASSAHASPNFSENPAGPVSATPADSSAQKRTVPISRHGSSGYGIV